MTGKQRILAALDRQRPDRVPTFEWFIDAGVGEALVGTRDAIEIVDRLDIDGINIRADYRREKLDDETFADEWGSVRRLTGDAIPHIEKNPIPDIAQHRSFAFPDPEWPGRFATLERALQRFGDRRAIILNLRDGFSDMRDLLGYEDALVNLLAEPEHFGELLDRCVDFNLAMAAVARRRYGVDVVATTDDVANATNLLMSPGVYFDLLAPRFARVMKGYRELGYKIVKHCDGNVLPLVDFWIESGIDCLDPIDPGAGLTMAGMKARYGHRICLKGNIDCAGVLVEGTPAQVQADVRQCIADGGPAGLIVSSSNTIHQGVKPANYRAMLDALREYGKATPLHEQG